MENCFICDFKRIVRLNFFSKCIISLTLLIFNVYSYNLKHKANPSESSNNSFSLFNSFNSNIQNMNSKVYVNKMNDNFLEKEFLIFNTLNIDNIPCLDFKEIKYLDNFDFNFTSTENNSHSFEAKPNREYKDRICIFDITSSQRIRCLKVMEGIFKINLSEACLRIINNKSDYIKMMNTSQLFCCKFVQNSSCIPISDSNKWKNKSTVKYDIHININDSKNLISLNNSYFQGKISFQFFQLFVNKGKMNSFNQQENRDKYIKKEYIDNLKSIFEFNKEIASNECIEILICATNCGLNEIENILNSSIIGNFTFKMQQQIIEDLNLVTVFSLFYFSPNIKTFLRQKNSSLTISFFDISDFSNNTFHKTFPRILESNNSESPPQNESDESNGSNDIIIILVFTIIPALFIFGIFLLVAYIMKKRYLLSYQRRVMQQNQDRLNMLNEIMKRFEERKESQCKEEKFEECPICLGSFNDSEKIVESPCHHFYHFKCIYEWISVNLILSKCPICNFDLKSTNIVPPRQKEATQEAIHSNQCNKDESTMNVLNVTEHVISTEQSVPFIDSFRVKQTIFR